MGNELEDSLNLIFEVVMQNLVVLLLAIYLTGCASILSSVSEFGRQISEPDIITYVYQTIDNKDQFIDQLTNRMLKSNGFNDDKFMGKKEDEIKTVLSSKLHEYFEQLPVFRLIESTSEVGERFTRYYSSTVNISGAEYDHDQQALLVRRKPEKRLTLTQRHSNMISDDWPLKTRVTINDIYKNIDVELYLGNSRLAWSIAPEEALWAVKQANDPSKRMERKKKLTVIQGESPYYTYYWDKRNIKEQIKTMECKVFQKSRLLISCMAETNLVQVSVAMDS